MKVADELSLTIGQARNRDQAAFEALVDLYSAKLYGFLFRLTGKREDAEDLVQEVFVRLVQAIERYEHDGRFEAWLFRIAMNLARDRVRRLSRAPGIVALGPSHEGDGGGDRVSRTGKNCQEPAVDYPMQLADDVDRLQKALSQLPSSERETVMLRHYSDMTFAEIAAAMAIPLGTALARAHRGLARLRELMESD